MINIGKYAGHKRGIHLTNNVTEDNVQLIVSSFMNKCVLIDSKLSMPTADSTCMKLEVDDNIVYKAVNNELKLLENQIKNGEFSKIQGETQWWNFKVKVCHWLEHEFKGLVELKEDASSAISNQAIILVDNDKITKHEWIFLELLALSSLDVSIIVISRGYDTLNDDFDLEKKGLYTLEIVEQACEKLSYGKEEKPESTGSTNISEHGYLPEQLNQLVSVEKYISNKAKELFKPTETIDWTMDEFEDAIYQKRDKINISLYGVDNYKDTCDVYGKLHRKCLDDSGYKIILRELESPTYNEIKKIPRFQNLKHNYLVSTIKMFVNSKNQEVNKDITDAIEAYFSLPEYAELDGDKLYNKLVYIMCIMNRILSDDLHTLVYYGNPKGNDKMTLELLGAIQSLKVIIISSDKSNIQYLMGFKLIESKSSIEYFDMPMADSRDNIKTYAALAQRNVDETLFDGSILGMYKPGMFKTCKTVRFNTTYDEIKLWWNRELYLRPGFKAENDVAIVPTFFTVVSGVSENMHPSEYLDTVQNYCFGKTVLCKNKGQLMQLTSGEMKMRVVQGTEVSEISDYSSPPKSRIFYENGKLYKDRIKKSSNYQYKFMMVNKQDMILDAIETIINTDSINRCDLSKIEYADIVLKVLLNLNMNLLQLIQWFEFYTYNPNLVLTLTTPETLDLVDVVLLTFVSLMGFDVLIFVPTKYACIENIITSSFQYDRHEIGLSMYNVVPTKLSVNEEMLAPPEWVEQDKNRANNNTESNEKKKGFFSKLFGF